MTTCQALYLDLMKRCLTYWIYGDAEEAACEAPAELAEACAANNARLVRPQPFNPALRQVGRDWPPHAHTMIGLERLNNLQRCIEKVLDDRVPGDLMETGVWRGGASIFMRAVLKAYGVNDRTVWLADSFQGLPPPDAEAYPADADDQLYTHPYLAVSLEQVKANFAKYDLLDEQVRFLQGWFRVTLPSAPVRLLAVLRLDGDMYESTMIALMSLYSRLAPGGYIIVDDYGAIPACKKAVDDYRAFRGIREELQSIDWTGVYWRKGWNRAA